MAEDSGGARGRRSLPLEAPTYLLGQRDVISKYLKGKKKAESYKDPMLNDEARVEYMSNAGFLMVTLSYAVLYFRFAAFLGQKHMRVMTGLRIWSVILTLLLMLQMIMCSFVRFGTWKVMRFALAVLLFVSSIFIFVLLQLGL